MKKSPKTLKLASIVFGLIYGLWWWFLAPIRFDSVDWRASLSSNKTWVRQRMVDDLLKRYDLKGRTKTEIELLLGRPPATAYFGDYDYVYWLGPERGHGWIDSEWLCIKFNGEKQVIEATLLTD